MKTLMTLVTSIVFALAINIGTAGAFVKSGSVDGFTFVHASSHFVEPDDTAGSEGTLFSKIGGIGKSEVTFSASWDWGFYSGANHPCAIVEISGHGFTTDLIGGGGGRQLRRS